MISYKDSVAVNILNKSMAYFSMASYNIFTRHGKILLLSLRKFDFFDFFDTSDVNIFWVVPIYVSNFNHCQ